MRKGINMDEKIKEYRVKHKKCIWCKYCVYKDWSDLYFANSYFECTLKDKIINFLYLPRFCKYYTLKEKGKGQ